MSQTYDRENRGIPRLFARHLVGLLFSHGQVRPWMKIHDNACGPAVFASELLASLRSQHHHQESAADAYPHITATDISAEMIAAAAAFLKDSEMTEEVDARVMDSTDLAGLGDAVFDVSVTNFGIWLTGKPHEALCEVVRTLRPGGGVAVMTAWKWHGWLDLMGRISAVVRPGVEVRGMLANQFLDEGGVRAALVNAGFEAGSAEVEERTEMLRWEGEEDLRVLMCEGDFARFAMKDWEASERDAVPAAIEQALTDQEKLHSALAMTAWVITARK